MVKIEIARKNTTTISPKIPKLLTYLKEHIPKRDNPVLPVKLQNKQTPIIQKTANRWETNEEKVFPYKEYFILATINMQNRQLQTYSATPAEILKNDSIWQNLLDDIGPVLYIKSFIVIDIQCKFKTNSAMEIAKMMSPGYSLHFGYFLNV